MDSPAMQATELTPSELPEAIDRALNGDSILVLPRTRDGAIAEVEPGSWAGSGPAPALILFTSGSTGAAKGVALSAEALTTSAWATERFLAGPGVWHLCLPVNHIAGFQVELRARLAGRAPVRTTSARFTGDSFAAEIEDLLTGAGERPAYTSLVPTQLHRVLENEQASAAAARCEAILLGGSSISPALLDRADERGLSIVRTYGMSETAGGCVYDGIPFDGVAVTISEAGTIDLHGDVVAETYVDIGDDGTITALPSTTLTRDGQGRRMIRTSDLGRLDAGVLTVLGRADDIIISGGENVSPHALETGLLPSWQKHGIAEVLVTWVPDEEWGKRIVGLVRLGDDVDSAVEETLDSPRGLARLLTGLDHGMGGLLPTEVFVVEQIPNRSIGKPDRRAAADLALRLEGPDAEYPMK
ncbi:MULTISPECIES: AMP-binding protein [unclassified Brevibacterium]|uniref:AMP-binding protein n=1 Tax=unclassified Brevibacterium TaxID=2614124 RepID=UPI001E639E35|nr:MULTISPECIES: AMP-binding protein [unclassified Brevibacterium]MDK8436281.1 AMP-binding protein [Brevibacterium sp. H-BE7]